MPRRFLSSVPSVWPLGRRLLSLGFFLFPAPGPLCVVFWPGGQQPALSKVRLDLLLPHRHPTPRACRCPGLPESAGDVPAPAAWALRVPDADSGPPTRTPQDLCFPGGFKRLTDCGQSSEVKMPTEALAGWRHQLEHRPVHLKVVGSIPGRDTDGRQPVDVSLSPSPSHLPLSLKPMCISWGEDEKPRPRGCCQSCLSPPPDDEVAGPPRHTDGVTERQDLGSGHCPSCLASVRLRSKQSLPLGCQPQVYGGLCSPSLSWLWRHSASCPVASRELPGLVLPAGGIGIRPRATLASHILPRATCPISRWCNRALWSLGQSWAGVRQGPGGFVWLLLSLAILLRVLFNFCKTARVPRALWHGHALKSNN